jgi:hypothetical protein
VSKFYQRHAGEGRESTCFLRGEAMACGHDRCRQLFSDRDVARRAHDHDPREFRRTSGVGARHRADNDGSECPSGRNATASPSIRALSVGSLRVASAIFGNQSLNFVPWRLQEGHSASLVVGEDPASVLDLAQPALGMFRLGGCEAMAGYEMARKAKGRLPAATPSETPVQPSLLSTIRGRELPSLPEPSFRCAAVPTWRKSTTPIALAEPRPVQTAYRTGAFHLVNRTAILTRPQP